MTLRLGLEGGGGGERKRDKQIDRQTDRHAHIMGEATDLVSSVANAKRTGEIKKRETNK